MIFQSAKMAVKAVTSNKMRSFLTMLGIIIGVFALCVLVSLVSGSTDTITDSISSLGSDLLTVSVSDDKGYPVSMSDLNEFASDEAIGSVAPLSQSTATLATSLTEETAIVYGTTGAYFDISDMSVQYGRSLKTTDYDNHTTVAVVTADTAETILGRTDVVGETVKINSIAYTIVGVLEGDDTSLTSILISSCQVYIPFTSAIRIQESGSSNITKFYASAADGFTMDEAEDAMTDMLLQRFQQDSEAFSIINQSSVMDVMNTVTSTLSLLLGGIAAISLLVGGIGIMNIMLVSVTERTREIGIRKAIGAGQGTIMLQFLIEAFVISLIGCLFGIILSWVAMQIINLIGGVDYSLSTGVVIISILFSLAVGLTFGLYPANKAAKKRPIDALRYIG